MKTNDLLAALTDIDERDINNAKHPGKRARFTPKKIIVLAAALAVLLAFALPVAAAPVSRPAYDLLYAVSPQLAQKMKPVHRSDVKSGIRMEVISANVKDDTAEILVAFKDLEGDRIDGTTDLFDSFAIRTPYDSMGTCRFERYDPETDVAVYTVLLQNMNEEKHVGSKITFSVRELLTHKRTLKDVSLPLTLAAVSKEPELTDQANYRGGSYADTPEIEQRLSEANLRQLGSVLAAEPAIEQPVTTGVTLTAAGYTDGHLRIQLRYTDIQRTDNHGFLWLEDAAGNRVNPVYSESFWAEDHKDNGTGNNDSYEEYVFEIAENKLADLTVKGDFTTCDELVTGNWEITFPLEN